MYKRREGKANRYVCTKIAVHYEAFHKVIKESAYGRGTAYNLELKLCYSSNEALFSATKPSEYLNTCFCCICRSESRPRCSISSTV